jgi:hypothetical protein
VTEHAPVPPHELTGLCVPFLWPMAAATRMVELGFLHQARIELNA